MTKTRCLYCYQPLDVNSVGEYHKKCSREFFGAPEPPELPYTVGEINTLAEQVVRRSITVPGVQPKLSLHLERGKQMKQAGRSQTQGIGGRLTIVGLWGSYIFKPPTDEYPELPEVEDVTMHLAALAGITTVPHSLIRFRSGELGYLTKRIDRTMQGGKLHMEDACQLTGRLTEDKYHGSMEQVGRVIRQYSTNPGLDVVNFFELALFCYLTGNADMHLKNFSLLHTTVSKEEAIVFSPAYDLVATKLLLPKDTEDVALTVNGKKKNLCLRDFDELGNRLNINEKVRQNAYQRLKERISVMEAFLKISFLSEGMKRAYTNLLDERMNILSR